MALRIGLIGCGNISDIYLINAALFRDIAFTACADLRPEAAEAQARKYGIEARPVSGVLDGDDVDIVLNLTIPEAHAEVSLAALAAGKHVYGEKPLATRLVDGVRIMELADEKRLRVGAAPDTILGAGIQTCRALIDEGAIGEPMLGVASVLSHGMEHWHPNPEFYFKPGGGPVLDMGPYYIATLITLLGPVASVAAAGRIGAAERTITTPTSPRRGEVIKVETLTTVQAVLTFVSGAQVTFLASWDVWRHGLLPIELHGTLGSLRVPDPNFFGGAVGVSLGGKDWSVTSVEPRVFGRLNWPDETPGLANFRGLGLAEMAHAIAEGRPHRASGALALHTLAVMSGILEAALENRSIEIGHRCDRPAALGDAEAKALLGTARAS